MSITLRIPRELKSPNTWNGRHWRVKHRETKDWEDEIAVALAKLAGVKSVLEMLIVMNAAPPKRVCDQRRKVAFTRICPSARNFIRDDDNLRFAVKPSLDALKRLGLIKNDSRKWLEHETPTQEVSPIGEWATVITIESIQ